MPTLGKPQALAGQYSGGQALGWVEVFIDRNPGVDFHACEWLRSLPHGLQKMIVERGSLKLDEGGPTLTAVLINRINIDTIKYQAMQGVNLRLSDVDAYLNAAPVEIFAAERFRGLPRDLQVSVMRKRDLLHCRDPTMLLLGLVGTATRERDAVTTPVVEEPTDQTPDEMDEILLQIQAEEKNKGFVSNRFPKKNKRKVDKADAALSEVEAPPVKKAVVNMNWRSSRPAPEKESALEASAKEEKKRKEEKEAAEALANLATKEKEDELSGAVEKARAALQKTLTAVEEKATSKKLQQESEEYETAMRLQGIETAAATPSHASSEEWNPNGWDDIDTRPVDKAFSALFGTSTPGHAQSYASDTQPAAALDFDQIAASAVSNDPAKPMQTTWGGGGAMGLNKSKQKWGMDSYKSIFKNTPW